MRTAVAMFTVFAVLVSAPLIVLGQTTTPPAQSPSYPSSTQPSGTSIEGVLANVDATCGGKPSDDCLAIVEVTPGAAPAGGAPTPAQVMKIMIPKNLKINSENPAAATPVKLTKGDKVKITFEKKQDVNVATAVTVQKSGS
jgi:hypothetical protein